MLRLKPRRAEGSGWLFIVMEDINGQKQDQAYY